MAALGGQNPGGVGLPGIPGQAWRPRWPEGRPTGKTEGSDETRHTLRTVFWRTGAQNASENITYFEHPQKKQMLLTKQGAKYVTHTYVS